MKNRTELAKYFAKLGFTKGAEIGVYLGYYSGVLLDNIPDLELLCVDSWDKHIWRERAYAVAVEVLSRYAGAKILRGSSMNIVKTVLSESLDFVFIDADHSYQSVKNDIQEWSKKVRHGGIVSGHDYLLGRQTVQVIQAVDEYIKENNLTLLLTDHDRKNPCKDDRQPCWYFVKP